MRKYINITVGALFIVVGIFLLLDRFDIFDIRMYVDFKYIIKTYWATIGFVIPGMFLHLMYFAGNKTSPFLIVSGGAITFIGFLSQISSMYDLWDKSWPGFILALAVGLIEYFFTGNREKGVLISAIVIAGVSAILFSKTFTNYYFIEYILSMVLICSGFAVIFGKSTKHEKI